LSPSLFRKELRMADKIIKDFGIISSNGTLDLRLRLMSWGGNEPRYDIRAWNGDKDLRGLSFTEDEFMDLLRMAREIVAELPEEKEVVVAPKKRGRKPKPKEESKEEGAKNAPTTDTKSATNVIQFPGEKPNIIELPKTDGKATVLQCREKLNKEREIYKDSDSQYVIDHLLELCDKSQDFRNNVMREEKSYAGGFKYMAEQVRKGYCLKIGDSCQYLDNALAFALFVDYFNMDEEAMKEEEKKNAPEPKKRGRKKKGA